MIRKLTVLCAVALLVSFVDVSAQDAPVTDCDRLAAYPDDSQRKAPGVAFDKIDSNSAIPACEAAVKRYPNDARLLFQLGRAYEKAGNNQAAVDQYRKAAELGNAPAQFSLGYMFKDGNGVSKDDTQAVAWLRKAAEQGYAPAQVALGVLYSQGTGVDKDDTQAVAWFRKAAEQGYAHAQDHLAAAYVRGLGVSKNDTQAVIWLRKAAEQGFAPAHLKLGFMYADGRGVVRDDGRAYMWFDLAASKLSGELVQLAIENRDNIAKRLTPRQLAQAQEMARQCEARHFKDCD